MKDFLQLGVGPILNNTLKKNGITVPTPIQEQAIPVLLKGNDVIAQAQTGTGKTLAFMLPILERLDSKKDHIQALIITPTRELALQITTEVKKMVVDLEGTNVLAVYGGQDSEKQLKKLQGSIHIVIGTPGRLLDHLRRGTISLARVNMLVLDEADQMLQFGFLDEVEELIVQTSPKRQTMLFSATMPDQIKALANRYMKKPEDIRVRGSQVTLEEIKQIVIETTDRNKQAKLFSMIDEYQPYLSIIFCRTKVRAIKLNEALREAGYNSDELHGDLSQSKREQVMKRFRDAKIQLLVATDVAARGLDVEGITHVFNYDIPYDVESYIHRIGRTGRAGDKGVAITFVAARDQDKLALIERGIKGVIKKGTEDAKPKAPKRFDERKSEPRTRDANKGDNKKPGVKRWDDKKSENRRPDPKKTGTKRWDDKKSENRKPDTKNPEDRRGFDKKSEYKKPDTKRSEDKRGFDKKTEYNKPDTKNPEDKRGFDKKSLYKKADTKSPGDRRRDEKASDNRKPDAKKSQPRKYDAAPKGKPGRDAKPSRPGMNKVSKKRATTKPKKRG